MKSFNSYTLAVTLAAFSSLHAGQIAHYDFSDGDLYDNELGASYTLSAQGNGSVSLNNTDGTAVFTSAASSSTTGWLEATANLAPDDFTVSFWFRTDDVDQDQQFQGLFSSSTSGVLPGSWQVNSDGLADAGNLAVRFDGNEAVETKAPLHSANTWYHLVIRRDSDTPLASKVYLASVNAASIGEPVFELANNNSTLEKFALGVNRGTNQSYGMEMANVRIFDDSYVPLDLLFDEGPIASSLDLPAQAISFDADDLYVDAGTSVQLSWEVYEASSITIDNGVGDVSSFTSNGVGQTSVTVNATTTFTLTASNGNGSEQKQVSVNVGPDLPTIASFTSNDYYVESGSTVTLSWDSSNGSSNTLSTEGSVSSTGSVNKTVYTTTTYTLNVSNASGTAEEQITVHVGPARPNIIIFLVDDMGITDTSVPFIYDGETPQSYAFNSLFQTPNMETLAARGMVFSNAYAQTVCSPTRTSLMTGLNSTGHGVTSFVPFNGSRIGGLAPLNYRNEGMTTPNESTLPRWLGAVGYRTIHVGKAHFTYQHDPAILDEVENPTFIGFDINIAGSSNGQPGSYLGTSNYANASRPVWTVPGLDDHHGSDKFLTEACTIEAMEQVTEAAVNRGQPFFLHLSHYAVHSPFTADPRATGDYSAAGAIGTDANEFCTMMEGVDLSLGDVISHLETLGIAEETLIIFLGDNGSDNPLLNTNAAPDSGWDDFPMRGMKGNRSEGGVRIPLIISWAKNDPSHPLQQALPITGGSHESDIIACWDIPVTAANVADAAIPSDVHGFDLSNYLSGNAGEHRPQNLLLYHPHGRNSDYWASYYEDGYKLIYRWDTDSYQLFDLASDPTESNDLADTPGVVTVIATLADFTTDVGNLSGGFGPGWYNGGVFDSAIPGGWDAGDYDWRLGEDATASNTTAFNSGDFDVSNFVNSSGVHANTSNNIKFSRSSSPATTTTADTSLTVFALTMDNLSSPVTAQVTASFGASGGGTTGYQVYLNNIAIGSRETVSSSADTVTSPTFTLSQGDSLYFVIDPANSQASDLRSYNFTIEEVSVATNEEERILRMARAMARQFAAEWGIYGSLWPQFTDPSLLTKNIMGTLDLDGDGQIDASEDVNGNGLVDATETDPDDIDTDDDGTDDYSEIRLGLNPIDANESFKVSSIQSSGNDFVLTWPSQPGLTFSVRQNSDLNTPVSTWPAQTGIPAGAGNTTTWTYTGSDTNQFFSIELE